MRQKFTELVRRKVP